MPVTSSLPKSPESAACRPEGVPSGVGAQLWALLSDHLIWSGADRHAAQNRSIVFSDTERLNRRVLALKMRGHEELPKSAAWQPKASVRRKKTLRTWQRSRRVCREEYGADVKQGQGEVRKPRNSRERGKDGETGSGRGRLSYMLTFFGWVLCHVLK